MLAYLKALTSRLLGRGFGPPFSPPLDPSIGVREPRRRTPGGRSSAVALEEPIESMLPGAESDRGQRRAVREHADRRQDQE